MGEGSTVKQDLFVQKQITNYFLKDRYVQYKWPNKTTYVFTAVLYDIDF